jgi:hypothetical protein
MDQSATFVSVSLLCQQPPKDLMIEVRAVKDAGKIMTDSGPVSLDKGSLHFLKRYVAFALSVCCARTTSNQLVLRANTRSEVEQLIRDGMVEHVQQDGQC